MQEQININDFLESISKLSLDEQLMISEIVKKRVIEAKRNELVKSVRESYEEYNTGKTHSGTVEDFLKDVESD